MNCIRLCALLLLLCPILTQLSFKCAVLDGTTYFDMSELGSVARHTVDNTERLFFPLKGKEHYQLALCASINPTCTLINDQDMLVTTSPTGETAGNCYGFITKDSGHSITAHYSTLFNYRSE